MNLFSQISHSVATQLVRFTALAAFAFIATLSIQPAQANGRDKCADIVETRVVADGVINQNYVPGVRVPRKILNDNQKAEIAERLRSKTSLSEGQIEAVISVYDHNLAKQDEKSKSKITSENWGSLNRKQGLRYNKIAVLVSKESGRTVILVGDKIFSTWRDRDALNQLSLQTQVRAGQDYVPLPTQHDVHKIQKGLKKIRDFFTFNRDGAKNLKNRFKLLEEFKLYDLATQHGREFSEFLSRFGKISFIATGAYHASGILTWVKDAAYYGTDYVSFNNAFMPMTIAAGISYVVISYFLSKKESHWTNSFFANDNPFKGVSFKKSFPFVGLKLDFKRLFPESYEIQNHQIATKINQALEDHSFKTENHAGDETLLAMVHNEGSPFRPATWNAVLEIMTDPETGIFTEVPLDYQPQD